MRYAPNVSASKTQRNILYDHAMQKKNKTESRDSEFSDFFSYVEQTESERTDGEWGGERGVRPPNDSVKRHRRHCMFSIYCS